MNAFRQAYLAEKAIEDQEALDRYVCREGEYPKPMPTNTKCSNCGGFCPSGTLQNGLCSDCDLIGKRIRVAWGRFGIESCLVDHVSSQGTIYARRWNRSKAEWTKPIPVESYKGIYRRKGR